MLTNSWDSLWSIIVGHQSWCSVFHCMPQMEWSNLSSRIWILIFLLTYSSFPKPNLFQKRYHHPAINLCFVTTHICICTLNKKFNLARTEYLNSDLYTWNLILRVWYVSFYGHKKYSNATSWRVYPQSRR